MKKNIQNALIILSTLAFVGCAGETAPAVSIDKESIEHLLEEYEECQSEAENAMDCKSFTAKAISKYFGVEDLMVGGQYIPYDGIRDFVSESSAWTNYGDADNQVILDKAQQFANDGIPVIAINTNDAHQLAVLIVAGEKSTSSKWGVKVPSCAAFFPKNGPESFIDKTLNYAWSSPDGVEIWVRN